ncbi:hypothetical protein NWP22_02440 [Anabaenopsis tanganyikae CS-531]|uniref:Transposase n=2 Tax=Anabaenopsis TaxID=110103 RepID=A0ABT6KBG2_9CYAN|nr:MULTISPECIES: hypothetical protein [Anabaenopsis]MDB9539843.1 hypothetical protein [Anabaenopsis arnoldii]MDH6092148.1 hypothetical protein [Anabaenopsis arnoldii]MDH6104744.1 hypothetical protein [Anabaenopsis tanganyikae CS-531]
MVHLRDFSLVCPDIQNGDLLKAIEMAIPATVIEQAIAPHTLHNSDRPLYSPQ